MLWPEAMAKFYPPFQRPSCRQTQVMVPLVPASILRLPTSAPKTPTTLHPTNTVAGGHGKILSPFPASITSPNTSDGASGSRLHPPPAHIGAANTDYPPSHAKGKTCEEARKSLILALKEIEVCGEIRTTVDYLVQLLETDAFKQNTIDTSCFDGIIKEKSVYVEQLPHLLVASAAILKAHEHVKTQSDKVIESFCKGQFLTSEIPRINSLVLEIAYQDTKYPFHALY